MASKALKMNDLTDDVLLKLMERFDIDELCTINYVSKRFRLLASKVFTQRYANHLRFANPIENMNQTTQIIACFGHLMERITIEGSIAWELNESTLKQIDQHSTNKLQKISLIYFYFNKTIITIMKTLAAKLSAIELLYCRFDGEQRGVNCNIAFKSMVNLKEFVVVGCGESIELQFLNKKWENLKTFQVISTRINDTLSISQFLKKNPTIRKFAYLPSVPDVAAEGADKFGRQSWLECLDSDLRELAIEVNDNFDWNYVQLFKVLKKLQRITIKCNGQNQSISRFVRIFSKIDSLQAFCLWNASEKIIFDIPALMNIKTLELREIQNIADRMNLACGLTSRYGYIENLYLDHSAVQSANELGFYIENMPHLKQLHLCHMKSIDLMPATEQYLSWCSKRTSPIQVFIDSRYVKLNDSFGDSSQPVVFKGFNDRINHICTSSL